MLNNENVILANSRLSVNYAARIPAIMGCIILAALYQLTNTLTGYIFQWLWIILACVSYYKMTKTTKKINKEYEESQ